MGPPMTCGEMPIFNSLGDARRRPQRSTFSDIANFSAAPACDHFLHVSSTYPRQRKIADGKRLSIEQSAERIHAEHPGVPRYLIETHVLGWIENCAPDSYSERQLEELDRLIEPWLDDHERTSRAARK